MPIEKKLTPNHEIKEKYKKVGVVAFVINDTREVLVMRENSSKASTAKEAGECGVLCETSEGDESWMETLMRGFREELGIDGQKVSELLKIDPDNNFLGEGLFVEGVLARVCTIGWRGSREEALKLTGDGEVSVVGWSRIEDLSTLNLRSGVRNILNQCLEQDLLK